MDDYLTISAKLSAQKFLLGQLYAQLLIKDPASRYTLPKSLIDAAKFKSTTKNIDNHELAKNLQEAVVNELESFFSDVERRLQFHDQGQ